MTPSTVSSPHPPNSEPTSPKAPSSFSSTNSMPNSTMNSTQNPSTLPPPLLPQPKIHRHNRGHIRRPVIQQIRPIPPLIHLPHCSSTQQPMPRNRLRPKHPPALAHHSLNRHPPLQPCHLRHHRIRRRRRIHQAALHQRRRRPNRRRSHIPRPHIRLTRRHTRTCLYRRSVPHIRLRRLGHIRRSLIRLARVAQRHNQPLTHKQSRAERQQQRAHPRHPQPHRRPPLRRLSILK